MIGVSGGIDSTVALYLLSRALPKENIFPTHLPFFSEEFNYTKTFSEETGIPAKNFLTFSIKKIVEETAKELKIADNGSLDEKIRYGNLMPRSRMMFLYDLAKKNRSLVCGTENKTEDLLGYFTLHGDSASDIEPIAHLYKTQVRGLARHLKVPQEIIGAAPSAGLWKGQTDEGQFGFSYEEADQVLDLFFEKKYQTKKIISLGFKNTKKILNLVEANSFKHKVPYRTVRLEFSQY